MKYLTRLLAALCAFSSTGAFAQDAAHGYPNKPVRLVVPYAVGGGTDVLARLAAKEMGEQLGQTVIVDNRPGANALAGTEFVARAAPDGYTLLMAPSGPLVMNPVLFKKLPYSPQKDFVPISVLGRLPLLITVNASLPVHSVKELVEYARAHPKEVTYASSSPLFQLATELFKQKTGTAFLAIPYKSSGESTTALTGGQVTLAIADVPPLAGLIKAGKLRALGASGAVRSAAASDVPTLMEQGIADFDLVAWFMLYAPAATPAATLTQLRTAGAAALAQPEVMTKLREQGIESRPMRAEEMQPFNKTELGKWAGLVKRSGAQVD